MVHALWLVPALPLAGFLLLTALGGRIGRRAIAAVGVGSIAASASAALAVSVSYLASRPSSGAFTQRLWGWFDSAGLDVAISLRLDDLAVVMVLVVTLVGFLIHLYSAEYMRDERGLARFFAAMNLFVASMLVLVLADNLVLLYLGWEGVGLCSYLLIGFWYTDPANGRAARKAFVVTRVGDTALAIGLFLLYDRLGTLGIQEVASRATQQWQPGSVVAVVVASLVLAGAVGKSAQLPLQTWLPDAMAGPTPVSALIHAATMVTAGVYLIARTHSLFELAPPVMTAVAALGAATLLLAGCSALVQHDIKRVLAYSTISQIGYMFLALGVGAWTAAIFHLLTHACFKALLFLAAGVVIHALDGEHDMFRMGGLARRLPVAFWTFLVGAASLAGLPLITAGFYSKGAILTGAWESNLVLWLAGVVGALLTAVYIFRVVFVAFLGEGPSEIRQRPGMLIAVPLVVLAVLSVTVGFLETPPFLGGVHMVSDVLGTTLPISGEHPTTAVEMAIEGVAAAVSLAGLAIAWILWHRRRSLVDAAMEHPAARAVRDLWASGWGFDAVYRWILITPYVRLGELDKHDVIDRVAMLPAAVAVPSSRALGMLQNGRLRRYVAWVAAGAALAVAVVMLS